MTVSRARNVGHGAVDQKSVATCFVFNLNTDVGLHHVCLEVSDFFHFNFARARVVWAGVRECVSHQDLTVSQNKSSLSKNRVAFQH